MKRFFRAALSAAIALLFTISLVACGGSQTTGEVDLATLAKTTLTDGHFADELTRVDDKMISVKYGITNATEAYVYMGSGGTPEELALFLFASEEDAAAGLLMVNMRVADLKDTFTDYNAGELPKVQAAFVEKYGNYVALCISEDSAAAKCISDAFSGK